MYSTGIVYETILKMENVCDNLRFSCRLQIVSPTLQQYKHCSFKSYQFYRNLTPKTRKKRQYTDRALRFPIHLMCMLRTGGENTGQKFYILLENSRTAMSVASEAFEYWKVPECAMTMR